MDQKRLDTHRWLAQNQAEKRKNEIIEQMERNIERTERLARELNHMKNALKDQQPSAAPSYAQTFVNLIENYMRNVNFNIFLYKTEQLAKWLGVEEMFESVEFEMKREEWAKQKEEE